MSLVSGSVILAFCVLMGSEPAEKIDEAYRQWLTGKYDEAIETLEGMDAGDPKVARIRAISHEAVGRYVEAEASVTSGLEKNPKSPELLSLGSELARLRGDYKLALERADQSLAANPDYLRGRWERVLALDATGQQEEIVKELEKFVDFYNDKQPTDAETLVVVAMGSAEYARRAKISDQFDFILNTLLVDARAADPEYWPTDWFAGELLLEKYNKKQAIPLLNNALQANSSSVDVLVSLGHSSMRDFDFPNGFNFAKQALEINPQSVAALCLRADLLILDERVDEAIAEINKALAINPHSEEGYGRLAACHVLKAEPAKAEELEKKVLEWNPKPGIFYARMGNLLEQRRQFTAAEKALCRAIELAPHLVEPHNDLGLLYMRVGKEDEAKKVFEEAVARDPFHVRVSNMTKVLNHLEDYQVLKGKHYELKVSGDQDGILGPYMLDYLDETHDKLCKTFGYEPPGLTKIEIMKNHQWFSARVVGLPSIGTVGACTGDVVALTSPQSLKQSYNWARVLTHEVTHVITLQQTNYRIPHWYTEALAVISEGYPRPQVWNELLAERVPKRDLLNLDTINHAFVRPKTPLDWQMAYCQAQLYAQYMQERFGEDALSRLLGAYRDGLPTEAAIQALFKVDKRDFEAGYVKYLDKVVSSLRVGKGKKESTFAEAERAYQADPKNADLAADLALHYMKRDKKKRARELAEEALKTNPDQPTAIYILAQMEWSIGKTEAALEIIEPAIERVKNDERLIDLLAAIRIDQKRFDEAAKLYQTAHEQDPYKQKWIEGLVKVYLKLGDKEKLAKSLEELAQMDADNAIVRQKLAELAFERKDWKEAARWSRETMYITIKPIELHRIRAQSEKELGNLPTALREYEVITKLEPESVGDGIELARMYVQVKEVGKAKAELERVQKLHPDHQEIGDMLKELEGS